MAANVQVLAGMKADANDDGCCCPPSFQVFASVPVLNVVTGGSPVAHIPVAGSSTTVLWPHTQHRMV